MSQINILDYVKCVYEQYLKLLEINDIEKIKNYKTTLKHAISELEYEIDDTKYLLNNKGKIEDMTSSIHDFNYDTLVKLCLFTYIHNKL